VTKIRDEYELVTRGVREAQRELDGLNDQYERGERSARELDEQLRDLNAEARRSARANKRAQRETRAFAEAMRAGEKRAQQFRRDLDAARSSAGRTAVSFDQLRTAALGIGAAAAGIGLLGREVFEAGQRGAKLLDFQANLDRTTISIERLRAASSDTIPLAELTRATVFAQQYASRLGIADGEQQAMLESAVALADAFDRDLEKSYRAVLDAVAGTTTGLRRQFGIVIDSREVYESYAAQLGIAASELSTFQKQAALATAVQNNLNSAIAGAPTKDFVTGFDQISTSLANFETEVETGVTRVLLNLIQVAGDASDAVRRALGGDPDAERRTTERGRLEVEIERTTAELNRLEEQIEDYGEGAFRATTDFLGISTPVEELNAQWDAANARLIEYQRQLQNVGVEGVPPLLARPVPPEGAGATPPAAPVGRAIPPQAPRPQPTLQDIVGPSGATEADLLTLPDAQQEAQDQTALVDALRERLSVQRMMIETTREQTEATRILADVHQSFADALGQSAAAAIFEGESFIGALHNKLRSLAAFYTAQALGSLALGLVTGNPAAIAASAAYGKAALAATAGAILTGGLSSTFGGGSTGGGGAGGGAGGGPTPVDSFARSRERDRDRPVVVQVSIGGRDFDAVAHDAVARDTQQPRRGVSRVEVR